MGITNRDNKGRILKGNGLKHGLSREPIYDCWVAMKARCNNINHSTYKHYGLRGIKVCDRWTKSFDNFLLDMGEKPNINSTLDRINNNGNYEPDNCRWISTQEQQKNRSDNLPFVGVVFEPLRHKWRADITRFGKKYFLGRFKEFDDAKSARIKAEKIYG